MSSALNSDSNDPEKLLELAIAGDKPALVALFDQYRRRLRQMVRLRLDRRLQGRVDPSDVLQEAFMDVEQQLPAYANKQDNMSFFLWIRLVTGQRMMRLHREHLGAAMRDVGREVSLYKGALPQATSISLAAQLLGRFTSVGHAAMRAEMQVKLQEAINGMDAIDREKMILDYSVPSVAYLRVKNYRARARVIALADSRCRLIWSCESEESRLPMARKSAPKSTSPA